MSEHPDDVVLHFSEDPTIDRFVPHVPRTNSAQAPAVWAIDADHAPLIGAVVGLRTGEHLSRSKDRRSSALPDAPSHTPWGVREIDRSAPVGALGDDPRGLGATLAGSAC